MKRILVTGSYRPFQPIPQRAAHMVGVTLARFGFGLVAGNATGVDRWVARAFCSELERRNQPLDKDHYTQLYLPYWKGRGSWWPGPGFPAGPDLKIRLSSTFDWIETAIAKSAAAIMIGGGKGALEIARRFIDAGKTVFPIPFTGGRSNAVFQEILRTWCESPVPGLSRAQFLTLASPWIGGTGPLLNLLLGTLAEQPAIFISYRRTDSETVVGRLYRDLSQHFGLNRVFLDQRGIEPADLWERRIGDALQSCEIGVVVIGRNWGIDRTREDDYVRREVAALLKSNKPVLPILVDGAKMPGADLLPDDVSSLLEHQTRTLDNASWDPVVEDLIRVIERRLSARLVASES
jgi:hypothetical protein